MGRIRHISIRIALRSDGYAVALGVFNEVEVIHRDTYDKMSWREATTLCEALTDAYRPGLELLAGGTQETLF